MTKIYTYCLLVFTLIFSANANSQWTESIGGKSADYGQGITTDASGNVYVIGSFRGKADFDPSPDSLFLKSSCPCDESDPIKPDVFFAKYKKSGALAWARKVGGNGNEDGKGIAVDASGNVYITGTFEAVADFDPSSSIYNITSNGGQDIFLAKYNSNGILLWAQNIGGASFDYGNSLSVSSEGMVTIAGAFNGNVDFDASANNMFVDAGSSSDPFFARYDTNGKLVWIKDITGNGESAAQSIFIDSSGAIYITGNFFGTSDFDTGAGLFSLTGTDAKDVFYAKYNLNGALLWADRIGGSGDQTGLNITADNSGNVYATGYYQGTIDFDPGAGVLNLSSPAFFNAYLLKLNSNGSFGWVKNIGGSQDDIGFSVAVDAKQNILAAGYFNETASFGSSATLISAGSTDIYLARYNAAGKLLTVKQAGGITDDWASAVATDAKGFIYVTGYFTGTATFNFENTVTLTSAGNADVYISKFKLIKNTTNISLTDSTYLPQTSNIKSAAIDVFPNPIKNVAHIRIKDASVTQIMISDLTGKPFIKMNVQGADQNINVSMLRTGTYTLQLFNKNNRMVGAAKIFKE